MKSTKTVSVKRTIFWVAMSCSAERVRCFGGIYGSNLQGPVVSQERNQQKEPASFVESIRSFEKQLGFTGSDFPGRHQAKAHQSSGSDIIVCVVNIGHCIIRFRVVFKFKYCVKS
jgi:hypothetical protein